MGKSIKSINYNTKWSKPMWNFTNLSTLLNPKPPPTPKFDTNTQPGIIPILNGQNFTWVSIGMNKLWGKIKAYLKWEMGFDWCRWKALSLRRWSRRTELSSLLKMARARAKALRERERERVKKDSVSTLKLNWCVMCGSTRKYWCTQSVELEPAAQVFYFLSFIFFKLKKKWRKEKKRKLFLPC